MAQSRENGFGSAKYEAEGVSIDVRIRTEDGTAWLTAAQIAELYGRDRSVIFKYIKDVLGISGKGEGNKWQVLPLITGFGERRPPKLYSLEVILEIGKRIGSENGNLLREWLEDYLGQSTGETMIAYHAGGVSIDVRVSPSEETVWLTQGQIAELFEVTQNNVTMHIRNILEDMELGDSVYQESLHTAPDGKRYKVKSYNLDMILAVGYRVRSKRAIEFRRWATSVLKRYLMKGYALDPKRLLSVQESIGELSTRIIALDNKIDENGRLTDERISKLEAIARRGEIPPESIFYSGEYFDARDFFRGIFAKAEKEIIVIDPYADGKLLSLLSIKRTGVRVCIVRGSSAKLSKDDVDAFNLQYGGLSMICSDDFHDRFALIDDEGYFIGASFNHLGKKTFAVVKLHDGHLSASIKERIAEVSTI